MLKLGFDISGLNPNYKEHSVRGIGRYIKELSYRLRKYDFIELLNLQDLIQTDFFKSLQKLPVGRQTIQQQFFYPLLMKQKTRSVDFLHFPAQTDAPAINFKKNIITVHDVIPLALEELYRTKNNNLRFKFARFLEMQSIRSAEHIITISECSKKDIIKFIGIPEEKITVIYNGINQEFFNESIHDLNFIKNKYKLPNAKLILYLGGIDPRKNIKKYLEVVSELNKEEETYLLIAGKIDTSRNYYEFKDDLNKFNVKERVIELGFVPDSELISLFKICDLFLFLSLYEGFGLPPLEAMATGIPVVSSNLSALGEVLGKAGIGVNPTDTKEILLAIKSVFNNQDLNGKLKYDGIDQAKKFNWDKCTEETLNVYQKIFNLDM